MEELLKLSKFRLQLRAVISDVRHLKERERATSQELQLLVQKQKQSEEEFGKRLSELQTELASSHKIQQKLEQKVNCLENENALLEDKQKELKGTINSLLQSQESFIKAYQDSTCEMKQAIEVRDRKIDLLSDKIKAHSSLLASIVKEASAVKKAVDDAQRVLNEKEEVVGELKREMNDVSMFKKLFIDKISDLEKRLRKNDEESRRKDKFILDLEQQLEAMKIGNNCQMVIDELQIALSAKEMIIQNLISEKKALHLEVGSLGFIIKKIQDAINQMNEKDRDTFSSALNNQDGCAAVVERENEK